MGQKKNYNNRQYEKEKKEYYSNGDTIYNPNEINNNAYYQDIQELKNYNEKRLKKLEDQNKRQLNEIRQRGLEEQIKNEEELKRIE